MCAVEDLTRWSAAVCHQLRTDARWQSARCVLVYHPLADEVDVRPLLDESLAVGKRVLLPEVVGDDLRLRRYVGRDSLRRGAFGIWEPMGEALSVGDYPCVDVAVVPGMAFDADGHRLGRGRGYYDRLLPRLPKAYKIGVCFPFQYVPRVPVTPDDVRMDAVICNDEGTRNNG
ncbi:MAG: 5-formyltetrahydrofolate cyclo-ligase [Bacteroidaceae bacterium]|nr:5-formyltetrahydrofolate cyclo-ligase [Bacteroidaceae bacterium]